MATLELSVTYENSNVQDQSGNGRDGTITGMTFETVNPLIDLVSGLYDGSGDYVDFGQVIPFAANQPWTLVKWFNVTDKTQFQPLIARQASSNQAGYMLAVSGFSGVGEIAMWMGTDTSNRLIKRSSTLTSNDTRHLAIAEYNGSATIGGLTLYLDNVNAGNGGVIDVGTVTDPNYSGINLRMGARDSDAGTFSLGGLGDNGRVYSGTLTAEERTAIWDERLPKGSRRRKTEAMRFMQ